MSFVEVECLESRRLLSASVSKGVLNVTGTEDRDAIELKRIGSTQLRVTIWTGAASTPTSQQTFSMSMFQSTKVFGLGGNDKIYVADNATIPNLLLQGGAGRGDTLLARSGRFIDGEIIRDGAGTLVADYVTGPEEYFMYGTPGADRISWSRASNGDDVVTINSSFSGSLFRTDGSPHLFGVLSGAGNDTIIVGDGITAAGDLGLAGGDGNDFFDIAPTAVVRINGGAGAADTFFPRGTGTLDMNDMPFMENVEWVKMDRQTELHLAYAPNVRNAQGTVFGNGDDNQIIARDTDTAGVTFHGGAGNDTLTGAGGPDKLFGDDDDDVLIGNGGDDTLDGGPGIDHLDGGAGNNMLVNGEDDGVPKFFVQDNGPGFRLLNANGTLAGDSLSVEQLDATHVRFTVNSTQATFDMADFDRILMNGGPGDDTIAIGPGVANVFAFGDAGNDTLAGNDLRNILVGDAGNDIIAGNGGNDRIEGGSGANTLDGGSGDDEVIGGRDADTITGGPGKDVMQAAFGDDTLFARDGEMDAIVQGGEGYDRAQLDANDPSEGLEELLA